MLTCFSNLVGWTQREEGGLEDSSSFFYCEQLHKHTNETV